MCNYKFKVQSNCLINNEVLKVMVYNPLLTTHVPRDSDSALFPVLVPMSHLVQDVFCTSMSGSSVLNWTNCKTSCYSNLEFTKKLISNTFENCINVKCNTLK